MTRTQIQLTDEQAKELRRLAAERGVSTAALIRQGVDLLLRSARATNRDERKQRALAASGSYRSGLGDLSARHDEYFAEAQSQ